ncbi:unnamed protein product, partial [Tetraodon nigroviridis]
SADMLDLQRDWSLSFAGCGFMGVYYVGVSSCVLERCPRLVRDASAIYGASAGALMAAVLSAGVPLEKSCSALMLMAREARSHRLGPLHPSFNLLQMLKDSLLSSLPEDAHLRVSGRLAVSLTRVPDGKNVLVSDFSSRDELVQALLCSCFVPLYCGVVPPTYRGVVSPRWKAECPYTKGRSYSQRACVCVCVCVCVRGVEPPALSPQHYVDGAVSDNLPRCWTENTVTISAYAGESDLCPPRGNSISFHQVRFNNVSIQVNAENMYRVASTFFPPEPQVSRASSAPAGRWRRRQRRVDSRVLQAMAEICHSGYVDALRFLQEN